MAKREFTKKYYDKWCWQVYRGEYIAGLIEAYTNGKWGVFGLADHVKVTPQTFPDAKAALAWLNDNPEALPI